MNILIKLSNSQGGNDPLDGYLQTMYNEKKVIEVDHNQSLMNTTAQSTMVGSMIQRSQTMQQSMAVVDQCKVISDKGNKSIDLKEGDLIRDVIYALEGIDTDYIQFNKKEQKFQLIDNIPVSEPVRDLVNEIVEIGWLYRRIQTFLQKEPIGLVNKSLNLAIKDEINEYYKLLTILQQKKLERDDDQVINLRKLVLWTQEPFERLKWTAIVTDDVKSLRGCNVLSAVNSYSIQGNPAIQDLITRIMVKVSQPMMKFINNWVFYGELNDPVGEFFVQCDESITNEDLWQKKYKLVYQQIPNIIDKEYAEKIFITGKSINFLRKCCDFQWKLDLEPFVWDNLKNSKEFKLWINEANKLTNKKLVEVLQTKFQLKNHMNSIKNFLLMGQGEFIQQLMDVLYPELNKVAFQVHKLNLVGLLETAVRSSNVQYQPQEFTQRLDVKLLEVSQGDQGWDIFSLYYHVNSPLSTVFSNNTMKYYLKIFNFLWRIKRVEYNLSAVWRNHMKSMKSIKNACEKFKEVEQDFSRCNLIRNEMNHFLSNFFNYMMLEVIESSSKNFYDELESVQDLNDIIQIHDNFVQQILEKGLLTEKSERIYSQLIKIFNKIYSFVHAQDAAIYQIQELQNKIIKNKNQQEIKKFQQLEVKDQDDSENDEFDLSGFKKYIINIRKIQNEYRQELKNFSDLLKNNDKLKFLSFRLDFNEYYSSRKINPLVDASDLVIKPLLKQQVGFQTFKSKPVQNFKKQDEESKDGLDVSDNFIIFGIQDTIKQKFSEIQQKPTNFSALKDNFLEKNIGYNQIYKNMIDQKNDVKNQYFKDDPK